MSDEADSKETGEHAELERAYDSEQGGQVPEDQAQDRGYRSPLPGRDDAVQGGERPQRLPDALSLLDQPAA